MLAALIPAVAAALIGCEKSDDASGAYWNSDSASSSATTQTASTDAPATSTSATVSAADAIDPNSIHYLHADVSGWPITSSLSVSIGGGSVNMPYDKTNVWPARGGLNANPWIIVNVDGQWTAATFEWLRVGQTSKPMSVVAGDHIKKPPLNNFRPQSGVTYGWMVTSLARDSSRTVNERTNIVLATWP
jgi:hypothetical protein